MRDAVYRDESVEGGTVDALGDRGDGDRGRRRDDDARDDEDASSTPRGTTTLEGKDDDDDDREGGGDDDAVVLANGGVVPPVRAPRLVTARTYETRPAEGTPIGGGGAATVSTPNGTFTFVTPSMMMFGGEGGEFSRETIERELAREFGGPVSELPADAETLVLARQFSRVVRLFAVVDMVFCVLHALVGSGLTSLMIIGPLCGFVGARMYSPRGTAVYALFCMLNIVWKGVRFIYARDVTARVLTLISVLLSVYIARLVGKFYAILTSIPYEGQLLLRQLDWASAMLR